jgi:lipopolysaccharide/colanic/teichoic acid biosynthesis glycosyltransferase
MESRFSRRAVTGAMLDSANIRWTKRAMDLGLAIPVLVASAPIWLASAAAIWIGDRGPILFKQERIGLNGRPFCMWKFRSMVVRAEAHGGQLTFEGDTRITSVGRFLRRTKIDELPQLVNVLRGEMSIVGPRPEVPRYVALYSDSQRQILRFLPGITDPASIKYRAENAILARELGPEKFYREQILPDKIRMSVEYASHANFWTDFKVIGATVLAVLRPTRVP